MSAQRPECIMTAPLATYRVQNLSHPSCLQDFNTKYMAATMAVILIIGPYFSGHLRPEATLMGRASMLSNMRYHTAVIISLFSACGSLAASSRKMMKLTAYAERLQQLEHVARDISSGSTG